ncbi:lantibiotic dehydratase [Actinomadura oligospora]|uniref:lantibiotic dehydratase n=1 Tax=Actinomadura oligospora TaxID=111804 RepID=UPI00047A1DD0|nr:lantibiotic dehydratase [Actinomadura oligospora]
MNPKPPEPPVLGAAAIEVFPDAVLRCAALPAQTLAPFHAPALAGAARQVMSARDEIIARRPHIDALLHAAVPEAPDRRVRRLLLAVKRQIHRDAEPLDHLDELLRRPAVDPALAEALAGEQQVRLWLGDLLASFVKEHAAVLRRERLALRRAAGGAHFRKALLLASPELSASWEAELRRCAEAGEGTPAVRSRRSAARTERMERGVFAYLVRAATRPTPHGLWAGVVPVGMDETGRAAAEREARITLRAAEPRHAVTPDLTIFQVILDAIVRRPRYRWEAPVRLAVTVREFPDGWHVWRPTVSERGWLPLRSDPWTDLLLRAYGDGHAKDLHSVISDLAAARPHDEVAALLGEAANRLVAQNMLCPDLRLASTDADPWTALTEVGDKLPDGDREDWSATVARLRTACRDLAEHLTVMGMDELRERLTEIREDIRAFAGRAGVTVGPSRWPVRVDHRPGLAATWTPGFLETVRRATAETLAHYENDQGPELLRRSTMRLLLGVSAGSPETPLELLVGNAGIPYRTTHGMAPPKGSEAARITEELRSHRHRAALRWRDRLRASVASRSPYRIPETELRSEPTAGPGGAVVLAVCEPDGLRVEWGRPHPLAVSARFEPLLGEPARISPLAVAVRDWYASWPSGTAQAIEIAGADTPNPNAAARPAVTAHRLASTTHTAETDRTVVQVDGRRLLPFLRDPSRGEALVPVYNSSAAVGGRDPRGFVLHRLALGHGWEFLCRRLLPPPAPGGHLPRIELPSSAVLSPARWALDEGRLAEMLARDEANRYLSWRAFADGLGLPETVWATVEDDPEAPPLFLLTQSPLAVAALLRRLEERPRPVEFFEVHGTPQNWVECAETGDRFSCELAVAWHDRTYWKKVHES